MSRLTDIEKEKVKTASTNINNCAKNMQGIFDELISTMNMVGTKEVFEGTSSTALMTNFDQTKSHFDSYIATVERFSNAILTAVTAVEATEQKLTTDANNLPN